MRKPGTSDCVYIIPGSGQPSEPSLHVTRSALASTMPLSATPKRFAASATTARRSAFDSAVMATGSPTGFSDKVSVFGILTGGATPTVLGPDAHAGNAVAMAAQTNTVRSADDTFVPPVTVYKRPRPAAGVP